MAALHIRDQKEFEQKVLQADDLILAEFWAEWCGPCHQIAPVLDEIAAERPGKITLAKVNIDQNPETQQMYGVRGIPTLIIFKNGQPVSTKVGSLPKSKLVEWIDSVIAGATATL
jgi:thioredoxin 1